MAAILLQDQEAYRLVAKVNAMTTHVPVGGLVYANASFCQLMVDGDPGGIAYDIIIDQEADSYAAKAQAQPGQALGNILFINGSFVQAFGAAAGGSGGGVDWADITGKPAVIAAGATQAAARTAIGAGTSSLALGTTSTTAMNGDRFVQGVAVANASSAASTVPTALDPAADLPTAVTAINDLITCLTAVRSNSGSSVTQLNALLTSLRTGKQLAP